MITLEKANKKIHPVETQWHYKMMTEAGFIPETKETVGFVRSYTYNHPNGTCIVVSTGVSRDHWRNKTTGAMGLWSDLEAHLKI